jgi:hypothetical protein
MIFIIVIDYIIIKKYKNFELNNKINAIIEVIKVSEHDINKINDMIDLLSVNKKREDILKKLINVLIKNKEKELKTMMVMNIKQDSEITSNIVKKHLRTYKNDLYQYKIYLRDFMKSLNESKEINIIISQL